MILPQQLINQSKPRSDLPHSVSSSSVISYHPPLTFCLSLSAWVEKEEIFLWLPLNSLKKQAWGLLGQRRNWGNIFPCFDGPFDAIQTPPLLAKQTNRLCFFSFSLLHICVCDKFCIFNGFGFWNPRKVAHQ